MNKDNTCDWITSSFQEFPGRLSDKHPLPHTPHHNPHPSLDHGAHQLLSSRLLMTHHHHFTPLISPLLPPAVPLCELQEPASGHHHLHAHSDCDLHPDQRGVLHHPPHERNLGQRCCRCGGCLPIITDQSPLYSPSAGFLHHFCLFSPDLCRPGVWCDELDHSPRCGSVLLRGTQRLHSCRLQVSGSPSSGEHLSHSIHVLSEPAPPPTPTPLSMPHHSLSLVVHQGCSSWAPERATCPTTCA